MADAEFIFQTKTPLEFKAALYRNAGFLEEYLIEALRKIRGSGLVSSMQPGITKVV